MPYTITSYSASKVKSEKRSLLNAIEFNDNYTKQEREKALLHQAIALAGNSNTKLYTIKDSSSKLKGVLGFIALSASEVLLDKTKKPVILIDLLLVNNLYRSKEYEHFENTKVSQLLLEYAVTKFYAVQKHIGVTYLVLYPDGGKENTNLVEYYKSMGFAYATNKHEWMYIKL